MTTSTKKSPTTKKAPKAAYAGAKRVTKKERIIKMLQQPAGVSLAEIVEDFGIQPHTARAMISVQTRERGLKAVLKEGRYTVS